MSGKEQKQTTAAVASGRRVIDIEIDGLRAVAARLGRDFERAVELVADCGGRIVVTGMGKSGQVSKKIAATLSSTGTTALFIHAAEAAHGDLGMLARGDLCLAVSNSGTTAEILTLLPAIKRLGIGIIALTGDAHSPLGQAADVVLDVSVDKEACPLDLAPTASTTAMLAMGDALALTVSRRLRRPSNLRSEAKATWATSMFSPMLLKPLPVKSPGISNRCGRALGFR